MAEPTGRFVGIGVGTYESVAYPALARAVSDVQQLAGLLKGFEGAPLVDPTRNEVSDHLGLLPDSMSGGGSLVLLWSGHGRPSAGGDLRLITKDSVDHLGAGVSAVEVVRQAALSGAGQVLFIIDTCFSGTAVSSAAAVAVALLQAVPSEDERVWVGVLASCAPAQTASDGVFGERLRALLRDGPSDPDQRRRWSAHNERIRGDDLCGALLKDWGDGDQQPGFQSHGAAELMLPNPLYDPGAPAQVVEHLLLAARGGPSADHRSWFTGRISEVNRVVSWVTAGERGMRVVTGSAGTGKSAILGQVVSLSDPAERGRLGGGWEHDDPGSGSVTANVHARGLTTDQVAERLDGQFVGCKLLAPAGSGRRNAAELVGALQRALAGGADPPVVAVDGLDEARGEAFAVAEDLLVRLAEHATVIVSTRDLSRDGTLPTLVEALRPGEVLNLDAPDVLDSGRRALHDYVVARLTEVDLGMDPDAVASYLSDTSSGSGDRPFLLARLVTDQLRAVPVNTNVGDWQRLVSHSTGQAFDLDLARIEGGTAAAGLARALLTALIWAYGAGLPEEEWLVVAGVLAGGPVTREDVSRVLDELGRYVVQDGEAGVAVYRLAHQSLADHLRPAFRPSHQQPFSPATLPIARALLDRYRTLIERGLRPEAPAYLWRYAWRHAALAGPAGLDTLRGLAHTAPALTLDVALAASAIASILAHGGRRVDAVAPTEEAVTLYRDLAADNPAYQPNLARALNNLEEHATGVGEPERAETQWRHALDTVGPAGAAVLLYYRVGAADVGSERAVLWLVEALRGVGEDRDLLVALHDEARRHRAAGPVRWDSHWQGHTGEPAPPWLIVDHELLATARQWIDTPTFDAERDFLAMHTELLGPVADTAVAEALLAVDEPDRYQQLRAAARVDGVETAYRPLLLASLAWEFAQADPATQRELLSTRRDDLLSDEVADALTGESAQARRAQALLSLAEIDRTTALDATLTALGQPDRFPELLHDTATSPSAADMLAQVAVVAESAANTDRAAARALFYFAVASALVGEPDQAAATLRDACTTDPDRHTDRHTEWITEWITELSVIGATHPAALQLIPYLLEERP